MLVEKFLKSARVPLSVGDDRRRVRPPGLPRPDRQAADSRAGPRLRHDPSGEKRGKLIEYLLNSEEFARNWARYWRDVVKFRATTQAGNRVLYDEMEDWLAEQFAKNRPWDEIARGVITATGRDDENGAVNFALAHEAQPVELAGEVSRIFLGVQIQCAQCHDHPTDSWKRQQFHEFAAYFAGVAAPAPEGRRWTTAPVFEVDRARQAPLHDARQAGPDEADLRRAQVLPRPQGRAAPERPDRRRAAGDGGLLCHGSGQPVVRQGVRQPGLVRPDGRRVLQSRRRHRPRARGQGSRGARCPRYRIGSKGGYDVRWLFRTILNSRTYQREVRSTYTAAGRTPFASDCPSPAPLRPDPRLARPGPQYAAAAAARIGAQGQARPPPRAKAEPDGGEAGCADPRNMFNVLFGVDPSTPNDDILGTIPQALFLMNGPQINRAIEADNGTVLGEILASRPGQPRRARGACTSASSPASRPPRKSRSAADTSTAVGNRREAFEDILWSLINSTEFVTRR